MKKKLLINGIETEVELLKNDTNGVEFNFAGRTWNFKDSDSNALFESHSKNSAKRHHVFKHKHGQSTFMATGTRSFKIEDAILSQTKGAASAGGMISPMPGKILKLFKKTGDSVKSGETILVMEAMKMEHAIKAPHDGVIEKLELHEGDQVDGGVVLVELKENT
tara:strand:- start:2441 stop:2932 length:492 start_codon:yes stop_codon:yes gene_type:complete